MIVLCPETHPQGSKEWLQARAGVITASEFKTACSRLKNGEFSIEAERYAWSLAIERIHGAPLSEKYSTWQMKRGTRLEHSARLTYEIQNNCEVEEVSLILSDCRQFGYSADGFIGKDGMVEIKTPSDPIKIYQAHFDIDELISEYEHQIIGGMWISGRKWCDLIIYSDWLSTVGRDIAVHRFIRDEARIQQLEEDLLIFNELVNMRVRQLKGK